MTRLITFIILLVYYISGCTKPEIPDKEQILDLQFRFNDSSTISSRFARIYGKSGNNVNQHLKWNDSILQLPLNMDANEVTFFFECKNGRDTLDINYEFEIIHSGNEYDTRLKKLKMTSSFRNLIYKCNGSGKNNSCDELQSAVVTF